MKKILILTAFAIAALLALTACTTPSSIKTLNEDERQEQLDDLPDKTQDSSNQSKSTETEPEFIVDFDDGLHDDDDIGPERVFAEYRDYRNDLISNINQSRFMDFELVSDSSSLTEIYEVDLIMWPTFIIWEDEDIVIQTGRLMGMKDFHVERSKDQTVMSYVEDNGEKITFTAHYDESNDHFIFKADFENGNRPYLEFMSTPWGFVGQSYTGGAGMLETLYLITVSMDTGIIGIIHDAPYPEPLTGEEIFTFPMSAPEYYFYNNGSLSGESRSGESFNLKPSD